MMISKYLKTIDSVIENGKFKDNWESLSQFKIPAWYRENRFGIFIHWGVYSVPAYFSEWYPRLMYIKGHPAAVYHEKHFGRSFDYRGFVEKFKPDKFVAEEWVTLFKNSGARHIMPVGEHHDGIKMYESDLNQWNMQSLNGRDYMRELHDACDKHDVGFCISNHRAEHYWFMNGARKHYPDSEIAQNKYTDLYGPALLPQSQNLMSLDKGIEVPKECLEDWLVTACEMIDKNKPLAVYFDWCIHNDEFRPYLKKFLAYYYNRGEEWGKEVAVFYKWGALFDGCGIFDVERGQINGVSRKLWQNDTAIAKNSWGYTKNNKFKSSAEILRNMIEVFAKNGCFMLNVGPKADGTICDEEKKVLTEIGEWFKANGEAVYGSYPFEICAFEGKKRKNGSFRENKKYAANDYCFTAKPGKIYVFPMTEKTVKTLRIKFLRKANENGIRYKIKRVRVLGSNEKLKFEQNEKYLTVDLPEKTDNTMPLCICVEVD